MKNENDVVILDVAEHEDDLYAFVKESLCRRSTLLSVAHIKRQWDVGVNRAKKMLLRLVNEEAFLVEKIDNDLYVFTDKRMGSFLRPARKDNIVQGQVIREELFAFDDFRLRFEMACPKTRLEGELTFDELSIASASCHIAIHSLLEQLNSGQVSVFDAAVSADMRRAVKMKVKFLYCYLMDLLLVNQTDNVEIIEAFEFFNQQCPAYAKNNMSFWFGVHVEGVNIMTLSNFDGNSVMLFNPKSHSMNFQRVRKVLPYDKVEIRNNAGKPWSSKKVQKTIKKVQADLCLSKQDFEVSLDEQLNVLTLNFDKSFPLHVVY